MSQFKVSFVDLWGIFKRNNKTTKNILKVKFKKAEITHNEKYRFVQNQNVDQKESVWLVCLN